MRKKKICVLHASVPFVKGGAELHVTALVKNLCARGYIAELIQIPYKWYPTNSLYDNLLMWRLLDLSEANGEKIDLVIGTKFPSYGAIHQNKVAWVIHQYRQAYDLFNTSNGLSHNSEGNEIKEKVMNFDKIALNECKNIYANSKNVASRLLKYNNINSIPLYHPPALVGQYYCNKFDKYILSVGRLDRLKRIDLLIKALPYCNKDIIAIIAGKGPELENLKSLASKCHVSERVKFLGFVEDSELLKLYSNASAVFFAPIDEDYGYITLESFLSGKPVITCIDSGGVLEFVKDSENGYICDVDERIIGEKIQNLISIQQKCQEMGRNGYELVKDITWDHVIDELTKTI